MKKTLSILLAATLGMSALAGCSSSADPNTSSASSSEVSSVAAEVEKNIVLGEASSSAKKVVLTNKLGKSIKFVAVYHALDSSNPVNLLEEGTVWEDGKTADWYIAEDDLESEDLMLMVAENDEDPADDLTLQLPQANTLPLEASLTLKENKLDLTWTENNETKSLLSVDAENESAPVDTEPAQTGDQEPVYQEPAYEEPVFDEPTAPSVPDQSADNCVDPDQIVLNPDFQE